MAAATCLPRETLKQYLVGDVEESQTEAIESHLASCEACEQTVVELEANPDTLLVGIRALTENPLPPDAKTGDEPSVVKHALAAARRLPESAIQSNSEWPVGQIGAYELLRPLGRGGMGMVVLARHRSLQKEVAIKLLSSLVGDKPELVSRFQREMRAAGRLQHPAIVNATDAGQERGTHYLVMEYVAGLDLSRIARLVGRLEIADACELMRQTALGLSHAHAEGIVHRDVKPSNLMLDASGHVKILDFGLAQMNLWDEPVCELTTVGQLMGTIDYMAPEQAERIGAVDYRADLYALGATLFRLIAGRAPLAAAPNMTLLEKVRLLGSQTSPLLSSVREDCPPELVQLVSQLLSRDPAARPASAAHVAEALEPFCSGSQLVELLAAAQTAASDPVIEPAVEKANRSLAQPSALQFAEAVGFSKTPTKPPTGRWLWTAAAAIPIMILAGILITIETQKGQLVIQSEVADVQVKVALDGKVVDELTIHPGAQSTRLRADKYEILIDSPSDQIVIDKQQFSIKSGETVVATIRQAARNSPDTNTTKLEPTPGFDSNEITHNLVGYSEWLHILATDTSSQQQEGALQAIIAISAKRNIADAQMTIVDVLRAQSKNSSPISSLAKNGFVALYQSFDRDADRYYEFLTNEIDNGPSEWSQLILLNDQGRFKESGLVNAALRIVSSDKAVDPRLHDAAVQYLITFIMLAKSQPNLESTVNKVIEVLVENPKLDRKFWFEWEFKRSREREGILAALGALLTRVAEKVMLDPQSSTEDRRRALRLLSTYDGKLQSTAWIEDYANALLDDEERLTANYRFYEDQLFTKADMEGLRNLRFAENSITAQFVWQTTAVDVRNEMFELLCVIFKHGYASQMRPLIERILNQAAAGMPEYSTLVSKSDSFSVKYTNVETINVNDSRWRTLSDTQRAYALIALTASQLLNETAAEGVKQANAPATQPSALHSERPIPSQPFFDGRTLSQWFEILERDRDETARLTAMKAIRSLANKAESSKITERLIELARQAKADEWSDYAAAVNLVKYGGRGQNPVTLDSSLIGLLIHLNGKEWFQNFLATDLLKGDDTWTVRWLAALLKNQSSWRDLEVSATIFERFKQKEAFDALGPNSTYLAEAWLIQHLDSNETIAKENIEQVIELIEHQPHLGKMAVLQVDAEIGPRFGWNNNSIASRSQILVEEGIATYAKAVLENDESSPEAVARAASRLASTTEIVDGWRPALLDVIRKRLTTLATDHTRLVSTLPIETKLSRPSSQLFAFNKLTIPVVNRFTDNPNTLGQSLRGGTASDSMSRMRVRQPVTPYIESECMAMIALMIRLNGAPECEKELMSIAEKTLPEFDSLMTQAGAQELRAPAMFWPYRINTAGELWTKISAETWLGWAIHRTLFEFFAKEKEKLPLLNDVLRRTQVRLAFAQADRNGDGKLSFEEIPQGEVFAVDSNKDGSIDFDEFVSLYKQLERIASESPKASKPNPNTPGAEMLNWVTRQIAKYDRNGDGKLSADERKSMLVNPEGADADGDGEVTAEEYADFRGRQ